MDKKLTIEQEKTIFHAAELVLSVWLEMSSKTKLVDTELDQALNLLNRIVTRSK